MNQTEFVVRRFEYPLQFEAEAKQSLGWQTLALDGFPQEESKATKRLSAYYQRLGFRRIGQTAYYVLSPAEKWLQLDSETLPGAIRLPAAALSGLTLIEERLQ